jgi:hypothetical protein
MLTIKLLWALVLTRTAQRLGRVVRAKSIPSESL